MSVLDRSSLSDSPLSDLHLIANELGLDGFRRLRKDDLVDAILARQSGEEPAADEPVEAASEQDAATDSDETPADEMSERPARRSRGGRGRGRTRRSEEDAEPAPSRTRGRAAAATPAAEDDPEPTGEERVMEGTLELLRNNSGFLRLSPPEPTDDDVYISAAQVRRCELSSGDVVAGPVRSPRRSERFPSLLRVQTVNGKPVSEGEGAPRFDALPVDHPQERIALGSDDPTLAALEWLTPFGRGSRVTLAGPARSGKTEALRRIAAALAVQEGLEVTVVLAGVRPEEIGDWSDSPVQPAAAESFAASAEAQTQAVERAGGRGATGRVDGGDAVVLVDSVDELPRAATRRLLASARNIRDGGSLTAIVTAAGPLGVESTLITLDATLVAMQRWPALDLAASGTLRPELLVGDAGAAKIAAARAEAAASQVG